ncbi:MAG: MmgE/PrpD family protein [Pseudomonadota bacterium]
MQTILQHFSNYISRVKYEDLPADVIHQVKLLTVDLLGVSIAGLKMDFPRMMVDYLTSLGGVKEATLLGSCGKVPAMHAALGNGSCGHALDMDDGYRFGGVHTGVAVIPAALAYAEANKRDGRSFLLAVAMGFEILNRLSKAMNPSHLNRGFHTTGTLGVFGAAAACGVIAGLKEKEMVSALAMAGLQGAGLLEILNDGAMVKPIHPGKAGMAGILSVELAKRGAKGPVTVLEGNKGLFKAMADEVKLDDLFKDLGKHFYINDQYVKFHAACRHTHPAIDGILAVMREQSLKFEDIDAIDLATYPVAISFCGEQGLPRTAEAAKFSLPYSSAIAAYFGDASEGRYVPSVVSNKKIRGLASRISAGSDEKWQKAYPQKRGATVTVKTTKRGAYTVEVPLAKGEPENRASQEEIESKYYQNAGWIEKRIADALLERTLSLEKTDMADLTRILRRIKTL